MAHFARTAHEMQFFCISSARNNRGQTTVLSFHGQPEKQRKNRGLPSGHILAGPKGPETFTKFWKKTTGTKQQRTQVSLSEHWPLLSRRFTCRVALSRGSARCRLQQPLRPVASAIACQRRPTSFHPVAKQCSRSWLSSPP